MSKELAVINPQEIQIAPSQEDLAIVLQEIKDMDRFPYGRIKLAAGGTPAFEVTEPGEEDPEVAKEVVGVLLMSHKANGYWPEAYGANEDKSPVCSSMDGEIGINRETGEACKCATCPYNQFGSAGRGKACKNMRRVYMLRPGDLLPLVFTVSPTGLAAYDKYRTRLMLQRKASNAVLTKLTARKDTNKDGIAFSLPGFDAIGALEPGEAARVKAYADMFVASAQRAGISEDDYSVREETPPAAASVPQAAAAAPGAEGFIPVDPDELPFA